MIWLTAFEQNPSDGVLGVDGRGQGWGQEASVEALRKIQAGDSGGGLDCHPVAVAVERRGWTLHSF